MSRIVIVILIYHRHKPINVIYALRCYVYVILNSVATRVEIATNVHKRLSSLFIFLYYNCLECPDSFIINYLEYRGDRWAKINEEEIK
jgi:hypothetical protein